MPHTAHTVSIDGIHVPALSEGHNPSSPQTQLYHINPLHLYNSQLNPGRFLPEPPPDSW